MNYRNIDLFDIDIILILCEVEFIPPGRVGALLANIFTLRAILNNTKNLHFHLRDHLQIGFYYDSLKVFNLS